MGLFNSVLSGLRVFGGNSGYVGYSKSRRAVEAESRGLANKSQMDSEFAQSVNEILLSRNPKHRKISLSEIKKSLDKINADEWHHTSKYGNRTNYYSVETIAEFFYEPTETEIKAERDKADKKSKIEAEYKKLGKKILSWIVKYLQLTPVDEFRFVYPTPYDAYLSISDYDLKNINLKPSNMSFRFKPNEQSFRLDYDWGETFYYNMLNEATKFVERLKEAQEKSRQALPDDYEKIYKLSAALMQM